MEKEDTTLQSNTLRYGCLGQIMPGWVVITDGSVCMHERRRGQGEELFFKNKVLFIMNQESES